MYHSIQLKNESSPIDSGKFDLGKFKHLFKFNFRSCEISFKMSGMHVEELIVTAKGNGRLRQSCIFVDGQIRDCHRASYQQSARG